MRRYFTYEDAIVPVHHPRALVEAAVGQGADREAIFEGAGITEAILESPEARLSYVQFATLARNALRLTGNPALGLDIGRTMLPPQIGVVGLVLVSSPTLGEALKAALRHLRWFAPLLEVSLELDGEWAKLTLREAIPIRALKVFTIEWALAAFDAAGRELSGAKLPVCEVRLPFPKPDHADRYRELYDVPIFFDQAVAEARFAAELLDRSIPGADPATAKLAERLCTDLTPLHIATEGLVPQIRRLLAGSRGRPPDLDDLARALCTSTRTLRRSLRAMGTSYQELLEEFQRTRAEDWVRSTGMTFDQIAENLGFSGVRSFRRAFKRWTGMTPNDFRAGSGNRP